MDGLSFNGSVALGDGIMTVPQCGQLGLFGLLLHTWCGISFFFFGDLLIVVSGADGVANVLVCEASTGIVVLVSIDDPLVVLALRGFLPRIDIACISLAAFICMAFMPGPLSAPGLLGFFAPFGKLGSLADIDLYGTAFNNVMPSCSTLSTIAVSQMSYGDRIFFR